jgi:radical SAM superfamily enzyme YgiQ (UPF0313 family)
MMRILFVFKNENFMVPLGLCAISAIAKKEGHKTYLCDIKKESPLKRIRELNPEIVAYSASTGEAKHYIAINKKIKERFPHIFTIMGGPHPTFYPEMIHKTTLDAICVGEGEGAFKDLLSALCRGASVEGIPNIYTKQSISWTLRHLIEDLDSLPFPDYALFYDDPQMGALPVKSFMTSRGCPYACTYCFNHSWNKMYKGHGKIMRRHSVDYVIEDILSVKKRWPLSCVKFYDDIFCYKVDDWLEEFCKKYKKYINLPFFILTRADLLTENMVRLLKSAGCRTISMSIEAGNERIRNKMLRRNMSDAQIVKAHKLCEKYGIYTFTNCIVGLPNTTLENEIESIDLAIKSKVTWAEFPIFYPYPRTELGEYAIKMGLYTPEFERMHTSYMHSSPLNCFGNKEKNIQRNIAVLGSVAVVFPYLRNLIVRWLIHLPHNRFFTFLYYIVKMWVIRRKIYVTKTSLSNSIRIFVRSLRQEIFRHEKEDVIKEEEDGEKLSDIS